MDTMTASCPPAREAAATLSIAVLIPCFNEAMTIASVVEQFRHSVPDATVFVYDNNSTDDTIGAARAAGAVVRRERRQGKGYVVRRMFSDIEADVYILVDGDATYEAQAAPRLVSELLAGPYDKVNGVRRHVNPTAYRPGHVLGNKLLSGSVAKIFGAESEDMLSGYKVLSRRFVKSFPASSSGFEIETELLIHALDLDLPMSEVETFYSERPAGSVSKLSTFRDGFRILGLIVHLVRDLLPLQFFFTIGALLALASCALGIPIVVTFLETGLVPRLPTAVLSMGLMIAGILAFVTGLILDSVARGRREMKLMVYLSYSPPPSEAR